LKIIPYIAVTYDMESDSVSMFNMAFTKECYLEYPEYL